MKLAKILPDVWRWTWFSQDKGMEFNGHALRLPAGLVLVDPVYSGDDDWEPLDLLGRPSAILLTNKDHERAAGELHDRYGAPVWVHEADAEQLAAKPDWTFGDSAVLFERLAVVRFTRLKSPGECAFHWKERRILIVGDLVTGHPAGKVGLVTKHRDNPEVLAEIRRILDLDFDALLVGDGEPFLTGGKTAVAQFLS